MAGTMEPQWGQIISSGVLASCARSAPASSGALSSWVRSAPASSETPSSWDRSAPASSGIPSSCARSAPASSGALSSWVRSAPASSGIPSSCARSASGSTAAGPSPACSPVPGSISASDLSRPPSTECAVTLSSPSQKKRPGSKRTVSASSRNISRRGIPWSVSGGSGSMSASGSANSCTAPAPAISTLTGSGTSRSGLSLRSCRSYPHIEQKRSPSPAFAPQDGQNLQAASSGFSSFVPQLVQ